MLPVDFADQMTRCYGTGLSVTDPVTGVDLSHVSIAGIMTLVKLAYDLEVNAWAAEASS